MILTKGKEIASKFGATQFATRAARICGVGISSTSLISGPIKTIP